MLASCAVCLTGVVASEDFTPQYIVAFGLRATGAVEPARFRCVSFTLSIPPAAHHSPPPLIVIPNRVARFWRTLVRDLLLQFGPTTSPRWFLEVLILNDLER
jgi:hypothetical protein